MLADIFFVINIEICEKQPNWLAVESIQMKNQIYKPLKQNGSAKTNQLSQDMIVT